MAVCPKYPATSIEAPRRLRRRPPGDRHTGTGFSTGLTGVSTEKITGLATAR